MTTSVAAHDEPPLGQKVTTGRRKTVAHGRSVRIFWSANETAVLIREMMSMQKGVYFLFYLFDSDSESEVESNSESAPMLPCFGQHCIIGSGTADSVLVSRRSHKTKLLLTSPRSRPYTELRGRIIGHTLHNLLPAYSYMPTAIVLVGLSVNRNKKVVNTSFTVFYSTAVQSLRRADACWPSCIPSRPRGARMPLLVAAAAAWPWRRLAVER
jgi:hypothetical protein